MARSEDFNRDDVLDRAKHLFWLKGYNGTSMQDLVDATGLNRSSVYNSFGNKMELYQQVLLLYKEESKSLRNRALAKNKNAIETIGLFFLYAMKDLLADVDQKGCMLINCRTEFGQTEETIASILQNNQEEFEYYFEGILERGQREGSIRKDEGKTALANFLVSAYYGFRITGMSTNNERTLKGVIHNILNSIS